MVIYLLHLDSAKVIPEVIAWKKKKILQIVHVIVYNNHMAAIMTGALCLECPPTISPSLRIMHLRVAIFFLRIFQACMRRGWPLSVSIIDLYICHKKRNSCSCLQNSKKGGGERGQYFGPDFLRAPRLPASVPICP